jgi:Uma2 family endonuclease
MGLAVKLNTEHFSYADYLRWPDHERWELIDGVAYDMSTAPSRRHQKILVELTRQFSNYLLDKTCEVYAAPFDVRLPEAGEKEEDIKTVLQPDISIICDPAKLDEKGCLGSPDLVVEIVSPATVHKDMREKLLIYERFGVKEYWIIQPGDQILMVFRLQEGKKYNRPDIYSFVQKVESGVITGLIIDLSLLV